jgi:hypothetical protein
MGRMLEVLAVRFPEWLRKITLPYWYGRYNHAPLGFEAGNWSDQQKLSMEEIATDIGHLLDEVHRSAPAEISELKEVKALECIWKQQIKILLTDKCETLETKDCASCVYKTGLREV